MIGNEKKERSSEKYEELFEILKSRFEKHLQLSENSAAHSLRTSATVRSSCITTALNLIIAYAHFDALCAFS